MRVAAAAAVFALTGCLYLGSARDFDPAEFARDPRWIRADVPLLLQEAEHDCGAAAVAMVLGHWERSAAIHEVAAQLPATYTQRYTAGDLKKAIESRGLRSRVFAGAQEHIFAELSHGRPVIVGLGKLSLDGARPHFEVVVAWHPVEHRVVTADPARGWRVNDLAGFLDEWDLSRRVMIVAYEVR